MTAAPVPGQPVVFRNATVLTMDGAHQVLPGADLLITGERIAGVGPGLTAPEGTAEIDATGGLLMPGMIDNLYTYTEWDAGSAQWKERRGK